MNGIYFFKLAIEACENTDVLSAILFLKKIVNMFFVVVPAVLILMIAVDMFKTIMSNDDKDFVKIFKIIIRRIIYAIVIFLVPLIAKFTLHVVEDSTGSKTLVSALNSCWTDVTQDTIDTQFVINKAKCNGDGYEWREGSNNCEYVYTPEKTDLNISNNNNILISSSSFDKKDSFVHYYQCDDWGTWNGKSICKHGCGPTSLAMIVATFGSSSKANGINPTTMGQYLHDSGVDTLTIEEERGMRNAVLTNKTMLKDMGLNVEVLFSHNYSTEYSPNDGQKLLNAVNRGLGVIVNIPGHYVVIGSNKSCDSNHFYLYEPNPSPWDPVGCYTPRQFFDAIVDRKNKCTDFGKCGWRTAWAYSGA